MSASYGDYPVNATVYMDFDSFAASTGAPSATSNFSSADIQIYKDGGTTQRSSANGITVTTSFDSQTGLQMVAIDLSDNTDAGFYAAGHEYNVAVADVTIDSQTMRFWLGNFSIERAGGVLALLKAGTAKVTLADGVAHGGTLGSSTATLALSRLNVTSQTSNTSAVTATGNGTGHGIAATSGAGATGNGIAAVSGATNGNGLAVTGAGTGNGALATGGAGAGGDGIEAAAGGGVDIRGAITGNVTGNLSGSVGSVTGAVGSVTGAVGSVTGNVGGSVASVTVLATDAIVAASISTAAANKQADHVWRRTYANARGSSFGDSVSFRSGLGMMGKLVNKWAIAAGVLTVYQEDDATSTAPGGTQNLTTDATADPITTVDTN